MGPRVSRVSVEEWPGILLLQDDLHVFELEVADATGKDPVAGASAALSDDMIHWKCYGLNPVVASFTANRYDVRGALRGRGATNELVIGVGASRPSLPPSVPTGWDVEKRRYIPGIFDSVELALCGTPNLMEVQVVPEIGTQTARVVAKCTMRAAPRTPGSSSWCGRPSRARSRADRFAQNPVQYAGTAGDQAGSAAGLGGADGSSGCLWLHWR